MAKKLVWCVDWYNMNGDLHSTTFIHEENAKKVFDRLKGYGDTHASMYQVEDIWGVHQDSSIKDLKGE